GCRSARSLRWAAMGAEAGCPPSHGRPLGRGVVRKERAMHEFNQAKSDAFVGKMIDIVNHAALALMTSIGRQTGLLEVMAVLPPSTSADIALAAGLQERYVR